MDTAKVQIARLSVSQILYRFHARSRCEQPINQAYLASQLGFYLCTIKRFILRSVQSSGSRRQFVIATVPALNRFLRISSKLHWEGPFRRQQYLALERLDSALAVVEPKVRIKVKVGSAITPLLTQVVTFLKCNPQEPGSNPCQGKFTFLHCLQRYSKFL